MVPSSEQPRTHNGWLGTTPGSAAVLTYPHSGHAAGKPTACPPTPRTLSHPAIPAVPGQARTGLRCLSLNHLWWPTPMPQSRDSTPRSPGLPRSDPTNLSQSVARHLHLLANSLIGVILWCPTGPPWVRSGSPKRSSCPGPVRDGPRRRPLRPLPTAGGRVSREGRAPPWLVGLARAVRTCGGESRPTRAGVRLLDSRWGMPSPLTPVSLPALHRSGEVHHDTCAHRCKRETSDIISQNLRISCGCAATAEERDWHHQVVYTRSRQT